MSRSQTVLGRVLAVVLMTCTGATAHAQLSNARIKGKVTRGEAAAAAGLSVSAVNKDDGFVYKAVTQDGGVYVITGVPAGSYELRIAGPEGTAKSDVVTVAVGQTATVDLVLVKKQAIEEIVVTGSRIRQAVTTSELGSNVSLEMIEALPTASHNFLAGVDLAPGVAFMQDPTTQFVKIQGGAQNRDNVNVFIDGVSQKNNILRGGLAGQDTTRGNPFPQSAVREYKVLTQNYKAEYDQVSGAAISAVTKSGGNELHGDAYLDRTESSWRATSPLEKDKERSGQTLLPSDKNEFGASVGGAIKPDVVNYFVAYDGKDINDSRMVMPKNLSYLPANVGVVPTLAAQGGSYVDPFTEHLVFGKVNAAYAEDRRLTAEFKARVESDHVPEDQNLSAHGNDKDRSNYDYRFDVIHTMSLGSDWEADTKVGYQYGVWNPKSASKTPMIKYKVGTGANATDPQLLSQSGDVIFMGGSPDEQRRGQSGFTLAQDLTFAGLIDNVFKVGAKLSALKYDLSGTSRGVDVIETLVDRVTGQPYYNGSTCDGTNIINGGLNSDQCKISRALAPASVSINNMQIGLYAQDDWTLFDKLELNLGVRWDVETNMLNNGYVTPADRVAALKGEDGRTFGCGTNDPQCIQAPAGQTYAESLAKGTSKINLDDYIATGNKRKAFMGAFAPRVGFSFDVLGDKSTVIFAGLGRSYDRTMANNALDEKQKNLQQPSGEIWLIRNDFKMPYTDQVGGGIRQGFMDFNFEAAASYLSGKNQFEWFSGNRDPNGGWYTQSSMDPLWGGPKGYGSLILGDFIGETRTVQYMFKAEKPYTKASGWTATVAYTYSDAKTKHRDWNDDIFDWNYGRTGARPWNTSTLIDKHRLVAAAMTDSLIPWDVTLSARFTYASGLPRRMVGCPYVGDAACNVGITNNTGAVAYLADSPSLQQLDFSLMKSFKTTFGEFELRADLLNVFNKSNLTQSTNGWAGVGTTGAKNAYGLDSATADVYEGLRGPPRTLKLAMRVSF
jgi:outer membrane receptor protein involved in Fe transport